MLNTGLLKHPLNWLTIWAMLLLAAFAGHYAIKWFNPGAEVATDGE